MKDDPHQSERVGKLFAEGPVWVSLLVLKETYWLLHRVYKVHAETITKILADLLETEGVVIEEPFIVQAALERYLNKPRLGFSDCLVLEVSKARGHVPLLTFDRTLAKEEGAASA